MSFDIAYFLKLILFSFVVIIIYNVLKIYILQKFKPNKWLIFGLSLATLTSSSILAPGFLTPGFNNTIWGLITSGIFVILFLWFFDLFNEERYASKDQKNSIKIKPKAKPNRIKENENKDKK